MGNIVTGLDIGTTKIACIIAEGDEKGGMKVLGVGVAPSLGLRKGVVVNIDQTVQGIKKAVKDAELMAGVEGVNDVYVGIAGEHIKSFNNSGAVAVNSESMEITEDDVQRAIENASAIPNLKERDTLHVVPQSFVVDDQIGIKDPIGMSGVRLEVNVHIITSALSSAKNIIRSIELAGLEVKDLVLEPYASSYSVLEKEEKEIGVALVDMGGGTTDIAIYIEDSLTQTAVVGIGGEYVTKDIAMGIRTSLEMAEDIKKKFGSAVNGNSEESEFPVPGVAGRPERVVSSEMLTAIIEPRAEEILSLVAREIEQSNYKDRLGAGIVLTGGGSLLNGVDKVAQKVFGAPVKLGIPQGFGGLVDVAKSPMQATGIGLCMYGLEKEKKHGNGEPEKVSDTTVSDIFSKVKDLFHRFM